LLKGVVPIVTRESSQTPQDFCCKGVTSKSLVAFTSQYDVYLHHCILVELEAQLLQLPADSKLHKHDSSKHAGQNLGVENLFEATKLLQQLIVDSLVAAPDSTLHGKLVGFPDKRFGLVML
jgi:hypothetical protein